MINGGIKESVIKNKEKIELPFLGILFFVLMQFLFVNYIHPVFDVFLMADYSMLRCVVAYIPGLILFIYFKTEFIVLFLVYYFILILATLCINIKIDFFGESPYKDVHIPDAIGIFNGSGSSANNGLLSDVFANLGAIGVVIMPVMIVLLFKLFELVTNKLALEITIPAALIVCMTYVSANFFSGLLSHGIFLLLILLFLMNTTQLKKVQTLERMT